MIFIFGMRTISIGQFIDKDHICYRCQAYDREVRVFRTYVHFCLIPVFPVGGKRLEMHCRNCGDQTKSETVEKKYLGIAKTPFYLYSLPILILCLAGYWFYWNDNAEKEKRAFIAQPAVGDVYMVKKGTGYDATYSFLRVINVSGDSVMLYHNYLEYGGFVSQLTDDDYFVQTDTLLFQKKKLKEMLEQDEIHSVKRFYRKGSGFYRTR